MGRKRVDQLDPVGYHERLIVRFWTKVDKSAGPDGCWLWTGTTDGKRYGHFRIGGTTGRSCKAHRVSWWLTTGEQPGELDVLHRCDNPPCCNPAHLFLGTHADNMEDKRIKGRATGMHGEASGKAKLTNEIVMKLRADNASGIGYRRLAKLYNIPRGTIRGVVIGERWGHLPGARVAVPQNDANPEAVSR